MADIKKLFGKPRRAAVSKVAVGHRSYLAYADYLYLKVALLLCLACVIAFSLHDPAHGARGNTFLGYGLGTLGAALIVFLAWFGIRKRRYRDGRGQAQGWASAHVYLGLSLLVVVTLHSGFRFGLNVHTFAYGLMCAVIVSGAYGVVAYGTLPRHIAANRRHMALREMLAQVDKLNQSALDVADQIDAETHAVVARSIRDIRIGGSAWEQLRGHYPQTERKSIEDFLSLKKTQFSQPTPGHKAETAPRRGGRQVTIAFVADQIFDAGRDRHGDSLQKLLQAIAQRKELVERINRDITLRARLNVWLYLHIPLTVALLTALVAHIISTFAYW